MAKQGEIDYLKNLSVEELRHAVNKPFSDAACDAYLMDIAVIMGLLPPPPARLLDLGCGTGWTSLLFAKRGYQVTGIDISADMIFHANRNKRREGVQNAHFLVGDVEPRQVALVVGDRSGDDAGDGGVFFGALAERVVGLTGRFVDRNL